jgi:hypothetical protein
VNLPLSNLESLTAAGRGIEGLGENKFDILLFSHFKPMCLLRNNGYPAFRFL